VSGPRGFTLLEVILTLLMSVALMLLIGGAMQFYTRTMDVRDMDIRQTQLATAVMQMIEDDLRAALFTRPVDTAGLEALLAATRGTELPPDEDLSAAGIDTNATSPESTELALTNTNVLQAPGLIGNQFQIQVDLSRLPRWEEFVAMIDQTTANLDDVPSDIKTVSYYVQDPGFLGGVQDQLQSLNAAVPSSSSRAADRGGLVRRSLDRAMTMQASLTGGLARLNQTGEIIAPEIDGIEFAYWDGITWLPQWSSDVYQELPLAIRVTLSMTDPRAVDDSEARTTARMFQHTIRLPVARPLSNGGDDALLEAGL
jgi:type II secretory pathway component PulJ